MKGKRIGEKFTNKIGQTCVVIEDFGYHNLTIIFEDGFVRKGLNFHNLKTGSFKNLNFKNILNVACIGFGNYNKNTPSYTTWINMIKRCYDKEKQDKYKSYKGCSVTKKWHNFQNFAKWYEENYVENWQLDKDILVKGNKIYSPETCCFVPQEINSLFTNRKGDRGSYPLGISESNSIKKFRVRLNKKGKSTYLGTFDTPEEAFQAYKTAKEEYIKEVANKWRGQITEEVYEAMINYKVEITD